MEDTVKEAIKKVIEEAYIRGIHGDQDVLRVKSGFHEDFSMLVKQEESISKVRVDQWLENIKKSQSEDPDLTKKRTTHTFDFVDVTGSAAVAKVEVYKDSGHFSTDYMLLYNFNDGWKIVSKIFQMHG